MYKIIKKLLVFLMFFVCLGCCNTPASAKDVIYLDSNLDAKFVENVLKGDSKQLDSYLLNLRKNNYNKYLYYMGIASLYKGNNKEAIDYLSSAIKEDVNNPYIYEFRAVVYLQLEDYQKVLEDANVAAKLLPNERNPYALRFLAHMNMVDDDWNGIDKVMDDYNDVKERPESNQDVFKIEFDLNATIEPING